MKKLHTGLIVAALTLQACVSDDVGDPPVSEFDFTGMFTAIADEVIVPSYQGLAQEAQLFAATTGPIAGYCTALLSDPQASAADAQASWRSVMNAVQRADMHLIGPAAGNGGALRNRLNGYGSAQLSTCGIDQSVVQAFDNAAFDVSTKTLNQRSMAAIEYLLFNEDLGHNCPSQIQETENWGARPEQQRRHLRCEYAQRLARDVADAAVSLHVAWNPAQGDYRAEFIRPLDTATTLGVITDALFAIEIDVKDRKLGEVVGLNSNCTAVACPERVESPYAEHTLQNIRENLVGFQRLYSGGEGSGLDDLILSEELPDLAQKYITLSQEAINLIETIDSSLLGQSNGIAISDGSACANAAANPDTTIEPSVCRLHGLLKRLTDSLRTEFVAAVNVDLPDRAQTDND